MINHSIEFESVYHEIFLKLNIPMIIIDAKTGDIINANIAACDYYSYSKEQLLSMNISEINTLDREEIIRHIDDAKTEYKEYRRFQHKLSSGEIRDVEVYSSFLKVGGRDLVSSIIHDVKEKRELEQEFESNKANFDALFNNSPEAIAIVDRNFKVLNINEKFKSLFQYNLSEIKDQDITNTLCDPFDREISLTYRDTVVSGKFVSTELKRYRKDGSEIDVLLMTFPLLVDGEVSVIYCIYSDIADSKKQEKQIEKLTYSDELTGLFNKRFLLDSVRNEILKIENNQKTKCKLILLVLKVNEFSEINKALGHVAGTSVIKEFSSRLRNSIKGTHMLAHLNEDEFAIMVPNLTDLEEIGQLTDEITHNLSPKFMIDIHEFKLTTNIGLAMYPDDGTINTTLLRRAEIAMDKSEMTAGNSLIQFENSYDKEIQDYFWIKRDLTNSIRNDELFLNYQPIFDISTNKMIGVEALVRWNHKIKGVIPPIKFIPIAEKTGMIHEIGKWTLTEACKQKKEWQEMGYEDIRMSVNVSVLQLEKTGFDDIVRNALNISNLAPEFLQLEITETYFTQDYDLIKKTIVDLVELGVNFSIDDFGTGYSSLGQLCELKINNLKIDKMFIDDVNENINKAKIVKAIISLADNLEISLTAEGVETEGELNFLKENQCKLVQGFIFSKPVEAKEIEKKLKNKKFGFNELQQ